jgi:hypothetical protein
VSGDASKRKRLAAGVAGAAVAIGLAFAGGHATAPTETTPACPQGVVSAGGQACSKEIPPPSSAAAQRALVVPQALSGVSNGHLPSSSLASATGCSRGLAKPAAAAWNHIAVVVHDRTGYWLQSNGDASCYRTFEQQVELRNYWCSRGACGNAAVPGTSNHGLGLAVDAPPQTVSAIHAYGGPYWGQGSGSCSDAPWESWHVKYCGGYSGPDPGPYGTSAPVFHPLHRGSHGPRVKHLSTQLAFLRRPTPKHPTYISWRNRGVRFDKPIAYGVRRLQRDGHLGVDGVYGRHTHAYISKRWRYLCHHHKHPC